MSSTEYSTPPTADAADGPRFPLTPASWYYACQLSDLANGPRKILLGQQEFVAFKTAGGKAAVLHNRCIHLGADLSKGCVVGERLQCPFHEWEFAADGRCEHIPASQTVPPFARQAAYPVAEVGGHLFFFNRSELRFPFPFYDGLTPADLRPAKPFDFTAEMPWQMIAANGFDLQHFRSAHDRELISEPVVTELSPFARRISAPFRVSGNGLRDRLTRTFSGPQVTMAVTSWCGTLVLVTAKFRRTTSYGMVCISPIDATRARVRTIVWVPRSRGAVGRAVFDPLDAAVRRSFIRAFVRSDQERSAGTRYTPNTLIEADAVLAAYFQWLQRAVRTP